METDVINHKNTISKNALVENCDNLSVSNDAELFSKIFSPKPFDIKIEGVEKDGDVVFTINQTELGINDEDLIKYSVIRSIYFANFIGEFLVRKHINNFVKVLLKMNSNEYHNTVCKFNHKKFGMFVCPKTKIFRFQFHISLVQEILVEDIDKIVSFKK